MIYLNNAVFPDQATESSIFNSGSCTYYTTLYPFQIFPNKGLEKVEFSDITIFCGGNGSGKSTLLNVLCEKLELQRDAKFNRTELYSDYVDMVECDLRVYDKSKLRDLHAVSRIITSDDVFNHILKVREKNENVDFKRGVIMEQRNRYRYDSSSRPTGINFDDPESMSRFRDYAEMTNRNKSFSQLVRDRNILNERTYSNGENGYRYFSEAIQPGGLYLLDEPENSLSAQNQLELVDFIQGMARFYDCQFIISSHSPFILATPFAKIYDMDSYPVAVKPWTELESIRIYHDFFEEHSSEFRH